MHYAYEKGDLYNGDTIEIMDRLSKEKVKVDLVLTSPPYNTQRNLKDRAYDLYKDGIDNKEYINWTIDIFRNYDKLLVKNGVILYNMSYGTENPTVLFLVLSNIISKTKFMISDFIVWKKKSAMPLNMSHNKLTRIWEFVFVITRKDEYKTFKTNRKVSSIRETGQKTYAVMQ